MNKHYVNRRQLAISQNRNSLARPIRNDKADLRYDPSREERPCVVDSPKYFGIALTIPMFALSYSGGIE